MIVRIVQMTFREGTTGEFTQLFEERKQQIKDFRGCTHLELWQDNKNPNIFFTCSNWDSEASLDHYRFSAFFKDTWGRVKQLLADKPNAWSLNIVG